MTALRTVLSDQKVIAVVGGGRWGRVVVSVLAQMELPFDRVVVVSTTGATVLKNMLHQQFPTARTRFTVVTSLAELFREQEIVAAIIVNTARLHFGVARSLLQHGIDVQVEKPIALSLEEASTLVKCAKDTGATLAPGLQYRFCSYLYRFAGEIRKSPGKPVSFSLDWADYQGEERYGEKKSYDASLNIAQDVMPHIWSILSTVLMRDSFQAESCHIESGGRIAHFTITSGELLGRVNLERGAKERKRILIFQMSSGEQLAIDFSSEPGTITSGGTSVSGDPLWVESPRPIARQLSHFFSLRPGSKEAIASTRACLSSVSFSERAATLLKKQQLIMLQQIIQQNQILGDEQRYALREVLAENLIERGFTPLGDNAGLELIAAKVADQIGRAADSIDNNFSELLNDFSLILRTPFGNLEQ